MLHSSAIDDLNCAWYICAVALTSRWYCLRDSNRGRRAVRSDMILIPARQYVLKYVHAWMIVVNCASISHLLNITWEDGLLRPEAKGAYEVESEGVSLTL